MFTLCVEENEKKLLKEIEQGKKIVVWGASSCAAKYLKHLGIGNDFVTYYVDKNKFKWNTEENGIPVKSTKELFEDKSVDVVIVATMYCYEVIRELEEKKYMGSVYNAFSILYRERQLDYRILEEHKEELNDLLADDKSKKIVDFICEHRKTMNFDFTDIFEPKQYFLNSIIDIDEHAVFVDGGAYHGETINQFIEFQNGEFDEIYSFEMDIKNYNVIKSRIADERIHLLNYGLWDKREKCYYSQDENASQIGEGDMVAECISLDEVIGDGKVTFIKMDIEGAELNALYGAKKCIERCRPQMAICVYHKSEDIYEITKLLHEWLPEAKLYLRHHAKNYYETVLYVAYK